MKKSNIHELYREVKRRKTKEAAAKKTLFTPKKKKGCKNCGKVTWKPNKAQ
ncbi:hypothetical protein WD019_00725 [Fictibacillus sp. Mic-4]|uniref:hypothetical protein n=1 Tax=Fictibacillus TaxID=1329200 RepID=UPI000413E4A2|nr:hypothetical protein [Fictibacillus gelatini]